MFRTSITAACALMLPTIAGAQIEWGDSMGATPYDLAISPDGTKAVFTSGAAGPPGISAGIGANIMVKDLQTGILLKLPESAPGNAGAGRNASDNLAVTNNCAIAIGSNLSDRAQFKFIDLTMGSGFPSQSPPPGSLYSASMDVAVSPDGNRVVIKTTDGTYIYNLNTVFPGPFGTIAGGGTTHTAVGSSAGFTVAQNTATDWVATSNQFAVTAGRNWTGANSHAQLFDLNTGLQRTIQRNGPSVYQPGSILDVAVSPGGKRFVVRTTAGVEVISVSNPAQPVAVSFPWGSNPANPYYVAADWIAMNDKVAFCLSANGAYVNQGHSVRAYDFSAWPPVESTVFTEIGWPLDIKIAPTRDLAAVRSAGDPTAPTSTGMQLYTFTFGGPGLQQYGVSQGDYVFLFAGDPIIPICDWIGLDDNWMVYTTNTLFQGNINGRYHMLGVDAAPAPGAAKTTVPPAMEGLPDVAMNANALDSTVAGNSFTYVIDGATGNPSLTFSNLSIWPETGIDRVEVWGDKGIVNRSAGVPPPPSVQVTYGTVIHLHPKVGTFCYSTPNSAGPGAFIGTTGTRSLTANNMVMTCTGLPPGEPGLFISGRSQAAVTPLNPGVGSLCIYHGTTRRHGFVTANAAGAVTYPIDFNNFPEPGPISAGDKHHFQFWHRDSAGAGAGAGAGANISDAVRAVIEP